MWLIIKVLECQSGAAVISDKFQECEDSLTLGAVFNLLELGSVYSVTAVYLSENGIDGWIAAELTHPVRISVQFRKPYVKYLVKREVSMASSSSMNAFDTMMAAARAQSKEKKTPQLPKKKSEDASRFTQKDSMFNCIIDMLEKKQLLFINKDTADKQGNLLVKCITDALWIIDEHHEKINHRATDSAQVDLIPSCFTSFRGFNDSRKKKVSTRLDRKALENVTANLFQCLSLPVFIDDPWKRFQQDIEKLALCLQFYINNLEKQCEKQLIRHAEVSVIPKPFEVHDINSVTVVSRVYAELDSAVSNAAEYEVIQADLYSPMDKSNRYLYFKNVHLSTPTQMYRYHQSGSLGTLNFIWKVPKEEKDRCHTKLVETVENIKSTIPVYHTRAMRREFKEKFKGISRIPTVVLDEMYRTLTSDATAVANPAIRRRLMLFLDADYDYTSDESVVVDLRRLNEGKSSKFETFWLYLEKVLQNYSEAADARRHGEAHLPVAISIPDLKKTVLETIPCDQREDVAVPSDECVRLQFIPINEHANSSIKFTKRFNIKYKVQRRCLRTTHEDDQYTASLFRYLKAFCVKYREYTKLLSCDDKHAIQVGEPKHPVAALDRGKRVIGHKGVPIEALDHDFTKAKLTPSVTLVIDVPPSTTESFYRGKVYVHVKDTIFSSSTPLAHGCELEDILAASSSGKSGNVPPILAIYTDGGPDHRTTYGSVQTSLLGIFKRYDLDMLVACRTAPGQSFINPVERIMSLLNLALNGVALERSEMSADKELVMRRCNSMADIREEASKNSAIKEAFVSSTKSVIDLVASRFNRLRLKDEPFCAMSSVVDEDELDRLFSFAKLIDPELCREKTTKKDLSTAAKYNGFLATHAVCHHYCFQLKKCGRDDCEFGCTAFRCPTELVETLSFLPDPVLDSNGSHYKPFEAVYGEPTTETDRPSLGPAAEQHDQAHKAILVSSKARMTVTCSQCEKPRVVYSPLRLEPGVDAFILSVVEFLLYSCGSPLYFELPSSWPDTMKQNAPVVRENITCSSPIEFAYYSCQKFPDICAHCANRNCFINSDLKQSFRTVLPICQSCTDNRIEPVTRGKYKRPTCTATSERLKSSKKQRQS